MGIIRSRSVHTRGLKPKSRVLGPLWGTPATSPKVFLLLQVRLEIPVVPVMGIAHANGVRRSCLYSQRIPLCFESIFQLGHAALWWLHTGRVTCSCSSNSQEHHMDSYLQHLFPFHTSLILLSTRCASDVTNLIPIYTDLHFHYRLLRHICHVG